MSRSGNEHPEIEVAEIRYEAGRNEVVNVVDNFIDRRYFDGIEFSNLPKRWEGNRRLYYGIRATVATNYDKSHLLGFVEITPLSRLKQQGIRVRIVCTWPPLLSYWEELPKILEELFATIEGRARIDRGNTQEKMDLGSGKAGRPRDPDYDKAYEKIADGEDPKDVFTWYCNKTGVEEPSKYDRNRFKRAMKYRKNNS